MWTPSVMWGMREFAEVVTKTVTLIHYEEKRLMMKGMN